MTDYTTTIPSNKDDKSEFTNPFTNQTYKRGELNIKVNREEIVGPKAQAVVKKQTDLIINTTHPDFPAIIDPTHIAIGPFVSALGDNLFFDTVLGVGTNGVFGYNHPNIFTKMQKLGTIMPGYMAAGTDFFFDSRHGAPVAQDLAEIMCKKAKASFGKDYMMNFANAGTESNENAIKIAMYSKFRQLKEDLTDQEYASMCEQLDIKKIDLLNDTMWENYPFYVMACHGAFHGRTTTSNSISYSKRRQKEGYQSIEYVEHVPYGEAIDFDEYLDSTPIKELISEKKLKAVVDSGKVPVDLLCAFIMESVQGEGGYVIPKPEFLTAVNDMMGKYRSRGLLLISDEVQTGLYRTGTFTGMENWSKDYSNLVPDVMSFAKPLHVGGVLAQKRLLKDWPSGKFSGTWAEGNLLGIAVAVYTMEELEKIDPALGVSYPENAIAKGKKLREKLALLQERMEKLFPGQNVISNIRGLGQMNAFDLPEKELVDKVVHEAFMNGMHLLGTGPKSIRIFGTVDQRDREADIIINVLEDSMKAVLASAGSESKSAASVS